MDGLDPGGMIPEDPEFYETNEETVDDGSDGFDAVDDGSIGEGGPSPSEEYGDTANLSWEELAVALGFSEEMFREQKVKEQGNEAAEGESNLISAADYKAAQQQKGFKGKQKKRPSTIGRDLRPFERFVDSELSDIAKKEMQKEHPFDKLSTKLEVCGLSYTELCEKLYSTHKSKREGVLPKDIEDLNLNICLDLISLIDECIFLDTNDVAHVLLNNYRKTWTPQIEFLKKELRSMY